MEFATFLTEKRQCHFAHSNQLYYVGDTVLSMEQQCQVVDVTNQHRQHCCCCCWWKSAQHSCTDQHFRPPSSSSYGDCLFSHSFTSLVFVFWELKSLYICGRLMSYSASVRLRAKMDNHVYVETEKCLGEKNMLLGVKLQ